MAFYEQEVDVMIDASTLQARVRALGAQITADYAGRELTLVGIMKGAVFFLTDLAREIDLPLSIDLMGVSSKEPRITHDLSTPVSEKHVLVVEDIVDTTLTMKFLMENLRERQPASLKVCALLEKRRPGKPVVPIDYRGFEIEDRFVVGYGLDYEEKYRNLSIIGTLK